MSDNHHATPSQTPSPHVRLIQMGNAYLASRIVYAAVKLGIADQLAHGPKSAAELADPMGAYAPALHRLMRALAGLGILKSEHGRFALTPLGEALKKGAPGSAWAALLMRGSPWFQSSFDHVVYSIQTGKTGFEKTHGMPIFDYLAQHPEEGSVFSEAMVAIHDEEASSVAAAYDFSIFKTIVDVGGATGNMLAAILTRHTGPRGILFDQPHVVADAPALLRAKGVSDRVTIEADSFFEKIPAGGDAYLLSHIIHDWSEDQCLTILSHVHKAVNSEGRLLLVEMVLPSDDTPHLGTMVDMAMLVAVGGQERTEDEYRLLLSKAGFRLTRVVPSNSLVSIVEAVVA